MASLFVGQLPFSNFFDADLYALMEPYGAVRSINMHYLHGEAFVCFEDVNSADAAIAALHGKRTMPGRLHPLQLFYATTSSMWSWFGIVHNTRLHHNNPKAELPPFLRSKPPLPPAQWQLMPRITSEATELLTPATASMIAAAESAVTRAEEEEQRTSSTGLRTTTSSSPVFSRSSREVSEHVSLPPSNSREEGGGGGGGLAGNSPTSGTSLVTPPQRRVAGEGQVTPMALTPTLGMKRGRSSPLVGGGGAGPLRASSGSTSTGNGGDAASDLYETEKECLHGRAHGGASTAVAAEEEEQETRQRAARLVRSLHRHIKRARQEAAAAQRPTSPPRRHRKERLCLEDEENMDAVMSGAHLRRSPADAAPTLGPRRYWYTFSRQGRHSPVLFGSRSLLQPKKSRRGRAAARAAAAQATSGEAGKGKEGGRKAAAAQPVLGDPDPVLRDSAPVLLTPVVPEMEPVLDADVLSDAPTRIPSVIVTAPGTAAPTPAPASAPASVPLLSLIFDEETGMGARKVVIRRKRTSAAASATTSATTPSFGAGAVLGAELSSPSYPAGVFTDDITTPVLRPVLSGVLPLHHHHPARPPTTPVTSVTIYASASTSLSQLPVLAGPAATSESRVPPVVPHHFHHHQLHRHPQLYPTAQQEHRHSSATLSVLGVPDAAPPTLSSAHSGPVLPAGLPARSPNASIGAAAAASSSTTAPAVLADFAPLATPTDRHHSAHHRPAAPATDATADRAGVPGGGGGGAGSGAVTRGRSGSGVPPRFASASGAAETSSLGRGRGAPLSHRYRRSRGSAGGDGY